jgi:16S rRNA U1498 N3-methylase RsmE
MTKQSTIVRRDALEQALQTVIQDIRIPKNLRTALAFHPKQRHGICVVPQKSTSLSTAFRIADGCHPEIAFRLHRWVAEASVQLPVRPRHRLCPLSG